MRITFVMPVGQRDICSLSEELSISKSFSSQTFYVWLWWKLARDSKTCLWLIRAQENFSSLIRAQTSSAVWERAVVALRAPTQRVCVDFFWAVFLLNSRRTMCVCVFVYVQYSKSFLWMKWNVNLTSVQNESVCWFPVFAELAFDLHHTSKCWIS